jgi:hypothetical protein
MVLVMVSITAGSATRDGEIEKQLTATIHREVVIGDLAGAMKDYRGILAQPDVPRPLAARAWLQIGDCLEKLGRGPEADNSYRRVESDYADQPAMVALARARLSAWVGPRNLNFEGQAGRLPPAPWQVQAPANDAAYVAEIRRGECLTRSCVVVTAPTNVPGQAGMLKQSFAAAAYRGKTVRLRAQLKIEGFFTTTFNGIRTPGADDRAQLWLRVERTNGQIGFSDSMDDRPIRKSEWSAAEITGQIDEDARTIYLGVSSFGGARAWVDELSFEVIGK